MPSSSSMACCHVVRTNVTDKLTGAVTMQSTGQHSHAIPCLDTSGKPTTGDGATAEGTFAARAGTEGHASEARFNVGLVPR